MQTDIGAAQRPGLVMRLKKRARLSSLKYLAILRVSILNNLAYIMEVFFRALLLVILVFVLTQLWKTTFTLRGTRVLSGFSIADMIWYLVAAETIALSLPALTRRIDQEVRSGQLAYLLGRPASYVLYNYAHYLGERLVRLLMNALIGSLLALVMAGVPHFTWQGLLAWPLVAFLALSIDFVMHFSIGLLAFWSEETQSFSLIFSRLTLVLGGVLAPLEIFPQPLRSIAQALPFSAILYGPARTLVHFEAARLGALLVQQCATLLVGIMIMLAIYHAAVRRVNINGG
ncbi:ABC transporter permease [Dictyobacter kobayashii]|uniref:Multidrug ABC transporter permease n=1 Tax=Dictyobacter kobayashii TaxID=2014872 RepID=A0A402AP24_9CHLR|nr:ABC-2 family transporter protein [Dictyobacter kobayashii]GCE20784.1 multidrug ABC transporter permease [Dictyobacter kobayashii]